MKNPFRSLPARIVAFVFGAIVLTSLIVTGLSIRSIDAFLREEINQKFPLLLAARADRLVEWYDARMREIEVFAQSDVLLASVSLLERPPTDPRRRRARDEVEQYLRYVLDGFRLYDALFILDAEGEVLLRVGDPIELSEAERRRLAEAKGTAIGAVRRSGERSVQIVSSPLAGSTGAARGGGLHAVFDVAALREQLANDDIADHGEVLIVDAERRIVESSGGAVPGRTYTGPLPGRSELVIVQEYERQRGERFVSGARGFDRFGWTLVVEEPYDQAFAPVVRAMRDVLLIDLAIVLIVGVAGFRIAVSIVRPIEALSQAASRISDGEKDVAIPEVRSRDEVGVLTRAFSAMTQRLTRNAAELELSHTALELANGQLQEQNDELSRVNEVLEQLSITDGLTKLHNHRHFQEVLLRECKRTERSGRPLALVLIDIDRFKHWNDRLGHAGGDEILRRMAEVLTEMVRDTDTLARYGGEEFALIAPNTDLEGARLLAEKIRARVAETRFLLDLPSEREPVTVSIGVSLYQGDRVRMFHAADRALYLAKESGRDCVMTEAELV